MELNLDIFQCISFCFSVFQFISIYFNLFQTISMHFKLFQAISNYFKLFQLISTQKKQNHFNLKKIEKQFHSNLVRSDENRGSTIEFNKKRT